MNKENDTDPRPPRVPEKSREGEKEEIEEDLDKHEHHQFSPAHERKMKELFEDEKRQRPLHWENYNFAGKLALTSFLLFLAVFVGAAADAIPMPKIDFSLHSMGDYSEIKMAADAEWGNQKPLFLDALYEPRKIPAKYERVNAEEKPANFEVNYTNGKDDIKYKQFKKTVNIRVNDEFGEAKKMVVGKNTYYFYSTGNINSDGMLTWFEGNYQFHILSRVDVNTMIKIAESIKKIE